MKYEVLKRVNFAGVIRLPGEIVEAEEQVAAMPQRMGLIAPAKGPAVAKPRTRKKKVEDEAPTGSAADD